MTRCSRESDTGLSIRACGQRPWDTKRKLTLCLCKYACVSTQTQGGWGRGGHHSFLLQLSEFSPLFFAVTMDAFCNQTKTIKLFLKASN